MRGHLYMAIDKEKAMKPAIKTVYTDDFMKFWKTYPGHPNQNKHAALVAWEKALEAGYTVEEILHGAQCHKIVRLGENSEYTQHAATWLSLTYEKGRGWESYDEDHWASGCDMLTAALIADLKVAWANPANEHNRHLVFRSVFAKYAQNQWVDHCEMPAYAKERLEDADNRLRELNASVKPFKLPDSQKPDWSWIMPENNDLIADFLKRRAAIKE